MDPKAAAKSKRSQSLQGKRNHPTPSTLSARSLQKKKESIIQQKKDSISQQKNPPQQGDQRARRDQRDLPSNWDRYEDDEPVIEQEGGPIASESAELVETRVSVVRKSKGADFGRLIEEARSRTLDRGRGDSKASMASGDLFEEAMPDLSSIISVRGTNLVSWCGNDNFSVDSACRPAFEVPLLSLDLQCLAAQISKLTLAERLFMQDDLEPEPESSEDHPTGTERAATPEPEGETAAAAELDDLLLSLNQRADEDKRGPLGMDELLAELDFLSTGPALSGIDASIDDLLAETQ
ncbi:phosphorelay protein [Wolffia australiana]